MRTGLLLPGSDEEGDRGDAGTAENARTGGDAGGGRPDDEENGREVRVEIDPEGLADRVVSLDVEEADYGELEGAGIHVGGPAYLPVLPSPPRRSVVIPTRPSRHGMSRWRASTAWAIRSPCHTKRSTVSAFRSSTNHSSG